MREIEARTAWQVPLAYGFVGIVVCIPIALIIAWTVTNLGADLAGENTNADIDVSVNLAIAATVSIGVVGLGLAYKIRDQKKRLRSQRQQLDDLEDELKARDAELAELRKKPKKR